MVYSWKQRYNRFFENKIMLIERLGRDYLSNIIDALIATADKNIYQEEVAKLIETKEAFQKEISQDYEQYSTYYLKKQNNQQVENMFEIEDSKKKIYK